MSINYSNVLTIEDLNLLSESEYEKIKLACEGFKRKRRDKEMDSYKQGKRLFDIQGIATDFAFRSQDFKDEPYFKKVLINANALLPTNDKIINLLLSRNITYKILARTINKLGKIKELAQIKDDFDCLDESTTISDKNLNYMCKIIKKYYPCNDHNLIIAKFVEIVVFEKELYLSLEGGPQKTR